VYLATVIDLYSRRLLGAATSRHPDAELACAAIKMAVTARDGTDALWRDEEAERVVFHTDRGSTYTANAFTKLCRQMGNHTMCERRPVRLDRASPGTGHKAMKQVSR
jgi:putative transposase